MVPGPGLRQPPGRAAAHPGAGVSPDRGPGRQGDPVHRRRQAGRPAQAVLPAFLHRRGARPASRGEGVGRPVRRAVRRRVGRLPGAGAGPAEGTGRDAARCGAVPARPGRPGLGLAAAAGAAAGRADDGGVRRVPVAHRPSHRPPAGLLEGDRRVRQHADHGGLRQRRQPGGRPGRDHQRAAVLQQRAGEPGGEPGQDRRAGRPRHLRPLPVGVDLGGQHPVPPVEAGDLPRRDRRPVPGALAGRDPRRGGRSAPSTRTSSTWCPPCWTRSAWSRPPRSGG